MGLFIGKVLGRTIGACNEIRATNKNGGIVADDLGHAIQGLAGLLAGE